MSNHPKNFSFQIQDISIKQFEKIQEIGQENVEYRGYFEPQVKQKSIGYTMIKKCSIEGGKKRCRLKIGSTKQPLASRFVKLITGSHYTKNFSKMLRHYQKSNRSMDRQSFKFWIQNQRKQRKNLHRVYCQSFINQFTQDEKQFLQVFSRQIIHRVYILMFETNLRNKQRKKETIKKQFLSQDLKNIYDRQGNLEEASTKKYRGEIFIRQQQNQLRQNLTKQINENIENIYNLESNQQLPHLDQQGKKKLQSLFEQVYNQCSESFTIKQQLQKVCNFEKLKQKIIDKMKYHLNIKKRQDFRNENKKNKIKKELNKEGKQKLQNLGIQPQKKRLTKVRKTKRIKRIKTKILIKKDKQLEQVYKNQQLNIQKNKKVQKKQFYKDEPRMLSIINQSYIQRLIKKVTKYHFNKNYARLKKNFLTQIKPDENGQISLDSFKMRLNTYFPKCKKSKFLQSFGNINQQHFVERIYQRGMQRVLGLMYESQLRKQKEQKDGEKTCGLDAVGRQKLYNLFNEIFQNCFVQMQKQINGFKLEPSKQQFKELLIKRLITQ